MIATEPARRETPRRPPAGERRVLMKGNEAIAEAAVQAGCDAYFGYPITPQAELLEWMARRMPELGRTFVQAESEIAAINMALGASAAGARVMVSSSGPGISLMAEAMSFMAGSELPLLLVDIMRGGPGLGNLAPTQADYFQATKGHGHGGYRVPVLAPASIDEAIDLVVDGFELAERYRTPVILLGDGILGQAMEPVRAEFRHLPRREDDWTLTGAAGRAPRVVKSVYLRPADLESHNLRLQEKYRTIERDEVRWTGSHLADAELLVVAYGTAARIARTAIDRVRDLGCRIGLLRPVTLWPFPSAILRRLAPACRGILVVELSAGQLVEDVRLAVEGATPVYFHGRSGGVLPSPNEIAHAIARVNALTGWADGPSLDPEADPVGLVAAAEWDRVSGRRQGTRR